MELIKLDLGGNQFSGVLSVNATLLLTLLTLISCMQERSRRGLYTSKI